MKTYRVIIVMLLMALVFSCGKSDEIDTEKPIISINFDDAFPVNCDTIYLGEEFILKVIFSDNAELGSFSIDIHHNFDHHSHSTELAACSFGQVKTPVNPFTLIQDYSIPEGIKEYETSLPVNIPSGNSSGLFDDGDYHLFISLTDKEGWSAQKGLSIKMLHH